VGGVDLFDQEGASDTGALSVSQVTRRGRQLVEAGFHRVWVRGEVTGLKTYKSGHWYFTLRDASAQVRCVMWRTDNRHLTAPPNDGTEIFVEAQPTVWEERGEFRLTVRELIPTAAGGVWQLQLERARAALERDGLLDPARKRPLPPYPRCIGVVTSPDGAALRDVLSVLARRWPVAEVLVFPSRVQGEGAEQDVQSAIERANRVPELEVLIVGRGGGSQEDLWAFNSEAVARAVAAARAPTVSAVGHETDTTLTDAVADVRAPTPSAAAETVVPDLGAVMGGLDLLGRRMARSLAGRLAIGSQRLARTADRLAGTTERILRDHRHRLEAAAARLDTLSPLKVLARGYAVARTADGNVLRRVDQFPPGTPFRLTVTDGVVHARAEGGDR
jgi:exodeoxyribonuclease VII large subunit